MNTYYAPAERLEEDSIKKCVDALGLDVVINTLLLTSGGILAILNKQRQILAVNHTFLRDLGIQDPEAILGLRLGESLDCVHSREMEGGCGTSKWCSTCGAAIATVSSLAHLSSEERKCVLTVRKDDVETTLCLNVRACFVDRQGQSFILLYIQDITASERRAALERGFMHDLKNVAMGIELGSRLLDSKDEMDNSDARAAIAHFSQRLKGELIVHAALSNSKTSEFRANMEEMTTEQIIKRLSSDFERYSSYSDKRLTLPANYPIVSLKTDLFLLSRVLGNMVTNAFEATPRGGSVKVGVEVANEVLTFSVWNEGVIPPGVCLRIFQQYFTTKSGPGRGIGTFCMKLLGEQCLGGKVAFRTSEVEGTTFSISLPRSPVVNGK